MNKSDNVANSHKVRHYFSHNDKVIGFYTDIGSMWFASEVRQSRNGYYFPSDPFCISHSNKDKAVELVTKAYLKKEQDRLDMMRLIAIRDAEKRQTVKLNDADNGKLSVNKIAVMIDVSRNEVIQAVKALKIPQFAKGSYHLHIMDIHRIKEYLKNK